MRNKIEHIATAHQNPAPLSPGDLLTEQEVADILRVAVKTVRNWRARRQGGPRFRKVSRLVRYHRADLAAFIEGEERAA